MKELEVQQVYGYKNLKTVFLKELQCNDSSSSPDTRHNMTTLHIHNFTFRFFFSIVNSYGSTDLNQLPINDKPFALSNLTYIAADWSTKMKEECFDAKEAEELDQHDSLRKPNLLKKQASRRWVSNQQNVPIEFEILPLLSDVCFRR